MKKSILLPVLTILAAAVILYAAAAGLSGVGTANAQREHLAMMRTLLPGSAHFTVEPYAGEDANIRSVHKGETGFVIEAVTAGYAGDITMLVGVSSQGRVTGLVVRDLSETWSLGANALTDTDFLAQFLNGSGQFAVNTQGADAFSGATGNVTERGEATDVDAITGATVTSKAVVRCVNSAVAYVTGADASSGATSWGG